MPLVGPVSIGDGLILLGASCGAEGASRDTAALGLTGGGEGPSA